MGHAYDPYAPVVSQSSSPLVTGVPSSVAMPSPSPASPSPLPPPPCPKPPSPQPPPPLSPPPPPQPPPPLPPKTPPPSPPVASFLALGDWGYVDEWRPRHIHTRGDHGFHDDFRVEPNVCTPVCQGLLADAMAQEAAVLAQTAAPVKFVLAAGDNFYPAGVSGLNDPVWETEWGQMYKGLPTGTPWYSVVGNHDYGEFNQGCACELSDAGDGEGSTDGGKFCYQVQKHGHRHGGQQWHMPKMSYYAAPLENARVEIVMLDLNILTVDRLCTWIACRRLSCNPGEALYRGCNMARCRAVITKRAEAAARLLKQRVEEAEKTGTQLIVVSHYPSTWLSGLMPAGIRIQELLSNPNVDILYFGAHVHSTDNVSNVNPGLRRKGWHDFCVGGGGGWACDGMQGFVAGEILENGRVANLRMIHVANNKCCIRNPHPG
mgnify:CR=1 FL=1